MDLRQPRCIRIFKTREEAEWAKKVLGKTGIKSYVTEDHFEKLTLADLGMESRFRLSIEMRDIPKAAIFLAQKLRKPKA